MIVTSFSQEGYHKYGKRFIETFLKHWKDEDLIVFYERGIPSSAPQDPRVTYVGLFSYGDFVKFKQSIEQSDIIFRGMMRGQDDKQPVYNFRFDAGRFFCKVFSIYVANKEYMTGDNEGGVLTWIDADSFTFKDVPENFVPKIVGKNYLAYLGRVGLYSECGFMAFNTSNPINDPFMEAYLGMFTSGAFVYLGEYTDCYVFDTIRTLLAVSSIDLAKGVNSDHPFVFSILGKYMDHLKGPQRKELGKSPELDNVVGIGENAA